MKLHTYYNNLIYSPSDHPYFTSKQMMSDNRRSTFNHLTVSFNTGALF